jgi:hypothetical protein
VPPRLAGPHTRLAIPATLAVVTLALGALVADRTASPDIDDGVVAAGVTVFADVPAVVNLDARLLRALRRAAADADRDGVAFIVNSGWRSASYQRHLLREAVGKYGSREAAARWVASAETSSHVAGHAVDVGPARARKWLARHGAKYGLCRTYRNEPWHFELRREALGRTCPPMYASPADDPRMQS